MATQTQLVTGNTYPVKDQLRAMGATWDSKAKGWRVPVGRIGEAQALVARAPKSSPRSSGASRGGWGKRWPTRRERSGDASTCSCRYCQSGSECLCIYA